MHFPPFRQVRTSPPLQALCTEASLASLRRHYPQIYDADDKLLIDPGRVSGASGQGRADIQRGVGGMIGFLATAHAESRSAAVDTTSDPMSPTHLCWRCSPVLRMQVRVERRDFLAAFQTITPASHRSAVAHARWGQAWHSQACFTALCTRLAS